MYGARSQPPGSPMVTAGRAAVVCVSTLALMLSACTSNGDTSQSGGGKSKNVTMNLKGNPESWNVLTVDGYADTGFLYTWPYMPHAFSPDKDGEMQRNKDLLKNVEIKSRDPFKIEYTIQKDAVWSDNQPITADDFKYTWKAQNPSICKDCKAGLTDGYTSIKKVSGHNNGKSVTVTFKKPFQPWKSLFSSILPAHIAKKANGLSEGFNKTLATSVPKWSGGPYKVSKYVKNDRIEYKRNPKWYGKPGQYKSVTLKILNDEDATVTAFENGEIDVASMFPTKEAVDSLKDAPNSKVDVSKTGQENVEALIQTAGDPLKDKKLRRAMTIAADAKGGVKRTVGQTRPDLPVQGSAVSVPGQKIGGKVAYRDNAKELDVGSGNVKKAKKVLDDAGYDIRHGRLYSPKGKKIRELTAVTYSADATRKDLATILQSDLKKLGIKVKIDSVGPDNYSKRINSKKFDILFIGAEFSMQSLSAASYFTKNGKLNHTHYDNPAVTRLLTKATHTTEPGKTIELMNRADKKILKDGNIVPYAVQPPMVAHNKKVTGIVNTASRYGPTTSLDEWAQK